MKTKTPTIYLGASIYQPKGKKSELSSDHAARQRAVLVEKFKADYLERGVKMPAHLARALVEL